MPKKKVKGIEIDIDEAIDILASDKDIDRDVIRDAIGDALIDTAKVNISEDLILEYEYNEEDKKFELYQIKTVVEVVENEHTEISLEDAIELYKDIEDAEPELGDDIDMSFEMSSRIDAYIARNAIIRKIKEAERKKLYNEFKYREGELITGNIKTIEGDYHKTGAYIVDIGKTEAILYSRHKPDRETLRLGDKVQAIIHRVEEDPKDGYTIKLSRKDPLFLIRLFEREVPEVKDGTVEIKNAVRDPGVRAKIAVYSTDSDTDPIGACVGLKGQRIKNIVQELKGEKVDIVVWSPNEVNFACNAIAPASVVHLIQDEENQMMDIIVPSDQLSLAIGKKGQNVKLASKLVNWGLRIISENDYQKIEDKGLSVLSELESLDRFDAIALYKIGFKSLEDIVDTSLEDFPMIPGFTDKFILKIQEEAKEYLGTHNVDMEREKEQLLKTYLEQMDNSPQEDENGEDEFIEENEFISPEDFVLSLPGVDEEVWIRLNVAGFYSIEDILRIESVEAFSKRNKFSMLKAKQILNAAKQALRNLNRKDKEQKEKEQREKERELK